MLEMLGDVLRCNRGKGWNRQNFLTPDLSLQTTDVLCCSLTAMVYKSSELELRSLTLKLILCAVTLFCPAVTLPSILLLKMRFSTEL